MALILVINSTCSAYSSTYESVCLHLLFHIALDSIYRTNIDFFINWHQNDEGRQPGLLATSPITRRPSLLTSLSHVTCTSCYYTAVKDRWRESYIIYIMYVCDVCSMYVHVCVIYIDFFWSFPHPKSAVSKPTSISILFCRERYNYVCIYTCI